jgi:hypothetical protein
MKGKCLRVRQNHQDKRSIKLEISRGCHRYIMEIDNSDNRIVVNNLVA